MRRLPRVRWVVLAAAAAAVALIPATTGVALPTVPMAAVLGLAALWNVVAGARLRAGADVTPAELFVQLCVDLVVFSALLFFGGGATNPLISLLLLPVAVGALNLSPRHVFSLVALATASYSLLMVEFVPLPLDDPARAARLHLIGMWLTFVVSAVLIAWLVLRMTASIRERDAQLARAREQALRDERVVAMGALAAGAAHELGTPLATMAVLAGELAQDPALPAPMRADLDVMRGQIAHCKHIISDMAERAGAERLERASSVPLDAWLAAVHARWRDMRAWAATRLDLAGAKPVPEIVAEPTLEQGLTSLLNNAANAGGGEIVLRADWDGERLAIEVRDQGPGFPERVLREAGRTPFPAHGRGSGIGLLLAHAAIERLGGRLVLSNPADGGGLARIELPLSRIAL